MAFMPEVDHANSATAAATTPQVFINDRLYRRITCTAVENLLGTMPGKAMLQIHSEDLTIRSPITLNALRWTDYLRFGSRVKVASGSTVYFLGTLIARQDQGESDAIVWTAFDDRWLLDRMPLRGCLAADNGSIKFLSRFTPRTNPEGAWNCMGAVYQGETYPVFSSVAEKQKGFEATETNFGTSLAAGQLGPWTPRRWLSYLWLLMYSSPDGWTDQTNRRNLEASNRISWDARASETISGMNAFVDADPLDKKLPDITFKGSVLQGMDKVLTVAGTHALQMVPRGDVSDIRYASLVTCPQEALEIPIIRGGVPDDINTAFDFTMHESAENATESVLVEGQPYHVETQLEWTPTGTTGNTIKPAWSSTREEWFKKCIWGAAEDAEDKGDWAMIPAEPDTEPDTACDGEQGRPRIPSASPDAISLARQLYPDVLTCWEVDSQKLWDLGTLQGLDENGKTEGERKFSDRLKYPFVVGTRPILPEQLQHLLLGAEQLAEKFPVRIQVQNGTDWFDAPFANGFKTTGVGFKLPGLAENADGEAYCIYTGSLITAPWEIEVRGIRVNAAVPTDHRVHGYAEIQTGHELDSSLAQEYGGPIQDYVDGAGFREDIQIVSRPSAQPTFANEGGQTENSDTGLTGYLPPGSEEPQAQAQAERTLNKRRYLERRSSWKMVGIRGDYIPGTWIFKVKVRGGNAGDKDYALKAPVKSVTFDFLSQTTNVGGLISSLPADVSGNDAPKLMDDQTEAAP